MTKTTERMLPLYEAKMIHHYDHRWATYEADGSVRDVTLEEKQDPNFVALPRYWVREVLVRDRLEDHWDRDWILGCRDICRSTDERTVIPDLFPLAAVGNNLPIVLDAEHPKWLVAVLSSFVLDFVARPKVGGVHLNFFIANQLPVLPPDALSAQCAWSQGTVGLWLERRVDSLVLGPWSDEHRVVARTELDAAMFHLYGVGRNDVDYIMDTFPIVKRKDEAAHGEYRTKRLILETYDRMAEAIASGTPYSSPFDKGVMPGQDHVVTGGDR